MKKIFSLILITLFIATGCGAQDENTEPVVDPVVEELSQNHVGPTEEPSSVGPTELPNI